ncbi:MAG: DUF512 domain-containing protein [Clostridiales bacterium]|nr:DUF512 domain-containing protein [Clostridiales bacterium]
MVRIDRVEPFSPAFLRGIRKGDSLVSINGHDIFDVLDFRFYGSDSVCDMQFTTASGRSRRAVIHVKDGDPDSIGLKFSSYLMDSEQSCRNKCIFCFVDQMPKGMRPSLYFKDDDSRLSFLFGNYITLTGLSEREVRRMIELHIEPVNISVHTMDPELRVKMMGNRFAGESLDIIRRLAEAGIKMNTQLVLCPGINDGEQLEYSLKELKKYAPAVQSIACVPVGLTKYREGLYPLRTYGQDEAAAVIDAVDAFNAPILVSGGERLAFAADEFYLIAGRDLPGAEYYGDYYQLENGVGLWRMLYDDFKAAVEDLPPGAKFRRRRLVIATGAASYSQMLMFADMIKERFPEADITVKEIVNDFFGHTVTVSGLLTGKDLIAQLKGVAADEIIVPGSMFRSKDDPVTLDDMTFDSIAEALGVRLSVSGGGESFVQTILG